MSRTSCGGALLLPGVKSVRPRLLGFRFTGVGGLTKDGETAEVSSLGIGKLVVDAARFGCREVFTARFFRFLPFFSGGCFCSSKNGLLSSDVRERNMPTANVVGGGDSGEESGDCSVALESSTVEIVVVGDDSIDPVVISLKLWWWNLRNTFSI